MIKILEIKVFLEQEILEICLLFIEKMQKIFVIEENSQKIKN
jgi:hypothetical protein